MRGEVTQRRDEIIALLSKSETLSAIELSSELAVSVQTIRADLRDLDEAGLVQRRNGNARLRQQSENIGYLPRESIARQEKQRIALAVKSLAHGWRWGPAQQWKPAPGFWPRIMTFSSHPIASTPSAPCNKPPALPLNWQAEP